MENLPNIQALDLLNGKSEDFASVLIERIKSGEIDIQRAAIYLKKLEKLQKLVFEDKEVKEAIRLAFEGSKSVSMYGSTIEYGATYTSYDYDMSNHPIYAAWKRIATEANANMKKIEEHLRTLKEPEEIAVLHLPSVVMTGGGGVVETVHPPLKKVTYGPKFKV